MHFYYVKRPLYGLAAGRVERFSPHKAGPLVVDGSIEPYDEQKHGKAPGAPPLVEPKEAAPGRRK